MENERADRDDAAEYVIEAFLAGASLAEIDEYRRVRGTGTSMADLVGESAKTGGEL
jgi:hypothetical protein